MKVFMTVILVIFSGDIGKVEISLRVKGRPK